MFEFQTAISELTGLPVSNAALYEGPSSVASAAYLAIGATKAARSSSSRAALHPHSRETLRTYAAGFGAEVVEVGLTDGVTDAAALAEAVDEDTAAVFIQNPNFLGVGRGPRGARARRRTEARRARRRRRATRSRSRSCSRPGECGADIAVGEGQPLGNRLDFGGPSFGFFAATEEHIRRMPGRIAGETDRRRRPPRLRARRCRPASSTSAARRRPTTSAPRRR